MRSDRNRKPLLENLKNYKGVGIIPFVDVEKDLPFKDDFVINSFFYTNTYEINGERVNSLIHLMSFCFPGMDSIMACVASVVNETTGWYKCYDELIPISEAEVKKDEYVVATEHIKMSGDMTKMHLYTDLGDGTKFDLDLYPVGLPIYNGGGGHYPLGAIDGNYQYSITDMDSEGSFWIEGVEHKVKGFSWFDRQWNNPAGFITGRWAWWNLDMDNGDYVSVWDINFPDEGKFSSFATVLEPDGTQYVVQVEKVSYSDIFQSKYCYNKYPTRYTLHIPKLNACLDVVATPRYQEVHNEMDPKLEAISHVSGIYKGVPMEGRCFTELVGNWREIDIMPERTI